MAEVGQPVLSEDSGGFTTEWYCLPPAWGEAIIVTHDEWGMDGDQPVRKIHTWRYADGETS